MDAASCPNNISCQNVSSENIEEALASGKIAIVIIDGAGFSPEDSSISLSQKLIDDWLLSKNIELYLSCLASTLCADYFFRRMIILQSLNTIGTKLMITG